MQNRQGKIRIEDLPADLQAKVRKRLPQPTKEDITKGAVAVLNALRETGLPVTAWGRILDTAKKWLKR